MNRLKAFTLIEMLIVVVIIGILAAALIPKLNSARGRANDVARKADLSQVMAGLVASQIDKGHFPIACGGLSLISDDLSSAGLDEIPSDPAKAKLEGFTGSIDAGDYGYCALNRHGQNGDSVVLAAYVETEGVANYVQCGGTTPSTNIGLLEFSEIKDKKCSSFIQGNTCVQGVNGICHYTKGEGQLRYIYLQ